MTPTEAKKRYFRTTVISMVFYLISVLSVSIYLARSEEYTYLNYILAIIPSLFVWWFIWGAARFFRETDEFERSRLIAGMLYGVGFIMVFSSGWGFMEMFADAPKFPVFYIFPVFCFAFSLGRFLTKTQGEGCS